MAQLALLLIFGFSSSCNGYFVYLNRSGTISEIPSNIPTNATKIDLRNNIISSFGPRAFSNFTSLLMLEASENPLVSIDYTTFEDTKIDNLILAYTQLTQIPDLNAPSLRHLHMQGHPGITHVDFVHLTLLYSRLRFLNVSICSINYTRWPENTTEVTIKNFDLTRNDLNTLSNGAMNSWRRLSFLYLEETGLSTFGCSYINDTELIILKLSRNHLTEFPDLQCVGQTLEILGLARNLITAVAKEDFRDLVTLVSLDLKANRISRLDEIYYM
ncbi:hypothetical protein CAPTEDRAFT_211809 [Capitella teleta]|uniref:LRRNT domain-containing protein n=1 Tax=Capitella teleta TaxID=283909 RepID=R7VC41_CAPTE|nr:hypothetical protein CAPTEDRAFT_211809 [Capitella teleta]|eukprot:ELU13240.1 hypothetical protein CAPTEDRAFT_211809 [Capitella teleta]